MTWNHALHHWAFGRKIHSSSLYLYHRTLVSIIRQTYLSFIVRLLVCPSVYLHVYQISRQPSVTGPCSIVVVACERCWCGARKINLRDIVWFNPDPYTHANTHAVLNIITKEFFCNRHVFLISKDPIWSSLHMHGYLIGKLMLITIDYIASAGIIAHGRNIRDLSC